MSCGFSRDLEDARAERAVDRDHAVVAAHLVALRLRKAREHAGIVLYRAAAATRERGQRIDADFTLLVEQPPDQSLERERGVGQFFLSGGSRQRRDMLPLGMIH